MLRYLIVASAVLAFGLGASAATASESGYDAVDLSREQALARQVKALKTRNAQLQKHKARSDAEG
ncbi:MAG TPA: hypothetical protein VFY54_16375 [Rubrobacter sp.]|nr:hypothetical protein [Rubrobacter sp.]